MIETGNGKNTSNNVTRNLGYTDAVFTATNDQGKVTNDFWICDNGDCDYFSICGY
jgi:hypothetical protein